MMRLFLSQQLFEDCIIKQDKTDPLWKLISDKLVDVFIDIDATTLDEIIQNATMDGCPPMFSLAFSLAESNNIPIYSGQEMIQRIKNKDKIKPTPAVDVYIFEDKDMTPGTREEIQNKYGVLCLSENYKEEIRELAECKYEDYMDTEKTSISWDQIIPTSNAPCNTLVFIDLYLDKNDKHSKLSNVRDIIASFCDNKIIESQLQIVFIWNKHNNSEENAKKFAKKIFEIFSKINNIRIEFILCDNNNDKFNLHNHTHNRRLLTNYSILGVDHTLAILENGIPTKDQRVSFNTIFSGTKSREHNTIIKKIAGDIKYAIINNLDCYPYLVCTNTQLVNKTKLGNLKNRLIMDYIDLKDGDKCYYLSVPYDNDWLNVKYLSGTYNSKDYQNCICEKEPKPILTKMKEELKRYFGSINFEMPTDDKEPFYWVSTSYPSDLKTVKVQESKLGDKIENCYPKNCFKNRKDAEKVVEKIKNILGLQENATTDK